MKRRATKSREIINEEDNKDGSDMGNNVLYKKRPMLEHPAFIRYVNNTTSLNGIQYYLIIEITKQNKTKQNNDNT